MAASSADGTRQAEITDSIEGKRAVLEDEQDLAAESDCFHAAVAAAAENDLFALPITSLHTITDGMPMGSATPGGDGCRPAHMKSCPTPSSRRTPKMRGGRCAATSATFATTSRVTTQPCSRGRSGGATSPPDRNSRA